MEAKKDCIYPFFLFLCIGGLRWKNIFLPVCKEELVTRINLCLKGRLSLHATLAPAARAALSNPANPIALCTN